MNTSEKVKQMAHLHQKQISDSSCKAIIIDTLLETVSPLTKEELSKEVLSLFHVLISRERLEGILTALSTENIILIDQNNYISIEPFHRASFITKQQKEISLRTSAISKWISHLRSSNDIPIELDRHLSNALPIFLRTLFVKHGVKSYELLSQIDDDYDVDIKQIANELARQHDLQYENEIRQLLPTVFYYLDDTDILEYLIHGIKKAVGYISEVISPESLSYLTSSLSNLVLYLDTNILYRLLHLQGDARYESIKETLTFCKQNHIKLRISAETKKEFSTRINYDAQVLKKYPAKVDLTRVGYKYRTSDNYVSTFWIQSQASGISINDYIQFYNNFDILLAAEGIEVEDNVSDEPALIEKAKTIFGKLSSRDSKHEKNTASLWHDAYNLAYVQKMQKIDAKNAIDTGCLFLTTDHSITSLQRTDYDFTNQQVITIAPSQLLQMFGFTKPDCDYEETFVKFFSSSSLGSSFDYTNDDIQEILSRISHYQGVNCSVAEKILARELLNSRYHDAKSDEDKETIIFNTVSEELLNELEVTKEEVEQLKSNDKKRKSELNETRKIIEENKKQYDKEIERLNNLVNDSNNKKDNEVTARKLAEEKSANEERKNKAQEEYYIEGQMKKWRCWRRLCFVIGLLTSLGLVAYFLVMHKENWNMLGLLAVTVPLTGYGSKAFSASARIKQEQAIKDEYEKMIAKKL